jgi:phage terminase large subunit-like protein
MRAPETAHEAAEGNRHGQPPATQEEAASFRLRAVTEEVRAALDRRDRGEQLADEAARLRSDFRAFVRASWHLVWPTPLVPTWHIDTICEHYQAAVERDITRLLVTLPPGFLKSTIISVLGPAWAWAVDPAETILSASHSDDLATRDTRRSRALMTRDWYQERFVRGAWEFSRDENLKTRYSNTVGGGRIRTHVGGGTGDRARVLQLDDPHNAQEAESEGQLRTAAEWWGDTFAHRLDDSIDRPGVKIVIGQRIHEDDLIGFLLRHDPDADRWTHLCLPVRYDPKHKYLYPKQATMPSGRTVAGDPRTRPGELLAPTYMGEAQLADKTAEMSASKFAGQYQQTPAPKEGNLLKRALWRYYPPDASFYGRERFSRETAELRLPRFQSIVTTWDTSVKDRAHSDYVSGQAWGVDFANRWLLRLYHERAGLNETIEAMLTMAAWVQDIWPRTPSRIVIETAANGADAIAEIRGRVQGVIPWDAKGTKWQRADSASPALDGRNCILPGYANEEQTDYDARTPADVQAFVEELAVFDSGSHDDQVDAWSLMVNWTRQHGQPGGTLAKPRGRKPRPAALPA